jgi:hypothetical protein
MILELLVTVESTIPLAHALYFVAYSLEVIGLRRLLNGWSTLPRSDDLDTVLQMVFLRHQLIIFYYRGVLWAIISGCATLEPDGSFFLGAQVRAVNCRESIGCLLAASNGYSPGLDGLEFAGVVRCGRFVIFKSLPCIRGKKVTKLTWGLRNGVVMTGGLPFRVVSAVGFHTFAGEV